MATMFNGHGLVVIGGQWGDEGKGRIVDSLAEHCDVVVRFQGGNNAGHSLHIGEQSLVLHLIPCGIMRKDRVCAIGNGMVIDPEVLFNEMDLLLSHGIECTPHNLKIAKNAHIIFPFHKFFDSARESKLNIGTTKRGIGPCYEDKVARYGIRANDLLSEDLLRKKISLNLENRAVFGSTQTALSVDEMVFMGHAYGQRLQPFLCDVGEFIDEQFSQKRRVLFEGAQGSLLDVDHGSYPFVTSSNCVAAQASIGSGIGVSRISDVLMVTKAYCTRVGEGPFFTEGSNDEQARFRERGQEFGATTKRPRRCGYLDLPALKYAARINGATGLILTKIDILAGLGPIKIATAYSYKQSPISFLDAMELFNLKKNIEVHYTELTAVEKMPEKINCLKDFPEPMQHLCGMIEDSLRLPIRMISYGQKRGQELFLTSSNRLIK